MENWIPLAIAAVLFYLIFRGFRRLQIARRTKLIDGFTFPDTISRKLSEHYPHLTEPQTALVIRGLRDYFHICNQAGGRMVSMPSQVVDVAWHEFILFTRSYKRFCEKALGRFLHHTPAEAMQSKTIAQRGIKTAWKIACAREGITPKSPTRLPLIFAIDAQLDISDGFRYSLNCERGGHSKDYCASHIGCGSCGGGCAADGCSGDSGCGGGCGGD